MQTDPTHRNNDEWPRPTAPEIGAGEAHATEYSTPEAGGHNRKQHARHRKEQTVMQAEKRPSEYINVGSAERLLSAVIGATILFVMRRRLFAYLSMLSIAGYLLYRGSSGHCPLYEKAGIDTSDYDLASLGLKESGSRTRRRKRSRQRDSSQKAEEASRTASDVREQIEDEVDEATLESFPASDPPSTW